jgi:hypothetical protein
MDDEQQALDVYFKTAVVLSSKMRSRRQYAAKDIGRLMSPPKLAVSPQMNWEGVGRELRALSIANAGQRCDCYWCRVYQNSRRGRRENYWVGVVAFAALGDPSALVKNLDSRRKLTRFDRRVLADLLAAVFSKEPERALHPIGRPKHIAARACASVARRFYSDWKAINRHWCISDQGHSDEMKDEACRVALEIHQLRAADSLQVDHPMNSIPTFEEVRELIDRARARHR